MFEKLKTTVQKKRVFFFFYTFKLLCRGSVENMFLTQSMLILYLVKIFIL